MKKEPANPNEEKIVLELKNKMVVLTIQQFDTDVDVEDILAIHHHNIIGECLTFPRVFNRIGNLKAEMENIVALSKVDLEIFTAELDKEKRKTLAAENDKKPSEKQIEAAILTDHRYSVKSQAHLNKVKNLSIVDSLYWSAKEKMALIQKFTDKLKPEEFDGEIIEGSINGILIQVTKKAIK